MGGVPINGTPGDDDPLLGTAANDIINGLAGDDVIAGLAGNDTLNGDEGDDFLLARLRAVMRWAIPLRASKDFQALLSTIR